jgi:hypothetical protein
MSNYFLFARPTFWSGMARVLDLSGSLNEYNYTSTPKVADFCAISSDWKAVGSDILNAMVTYEDEIADHGEED